MFTRSLRTAVAKSHYNFFPSLITIMASIIILASVLSPAAPAKADEFEAKLTIKKVSVPVGSLGFSFTVDNGKYHFLTQWGDYGQGEGEFNFPQGVAVDTAGHVFVADTANRRIQKFDRSGTYITAWGISGSGDGEFEDPLGVYVDLLGNVFVADTYNNRIQKFDNEGTFLAQWGSFGSEDGEFIFPSGVTADKVGNVYVADSENHRIQKFNSDGVYLGQWGSYGSGEGEFDFPSAVAVDDAGALFVADTFNHRIQKFDGEGTFLMQWGVFGEGNGELKFPSGIALGPEGNIFVADSSNQRIQKFDGEGSYLSQWGSYGSEGGEFAFPFDVAVDEEGHVYVADMENDRIQVFIPRLSATLDDGGSADFTLPPGDVLVSELLPKDWEVGEISCDSRGYGGFTPGDTTAVLRLNAGDDVTCTFNNVLSGILISESYAVSTLDEGKLIGDGSKSCYWINSTVPISGKIIIDIASQYGDVVFDKDEIMLTPENWDRLDYFGANFVCMRALDNRIVEREDNICKDGSDDILGLNPTSSEFQECGDHLDFVKHTIVRSTDPVVGEDAPFASNNKRNDLDNDPSTVDVLINNNDEAGILLTESYVFPDLGNSGEVMNNACYWVTLNSQPLSEVTINVSGDGAVAVNKSSIKLGPSNWNIIDISDGNSDNKVCSALREGTGGGEGSTSGHITHTATSADPHYNGMTVVNDKTAVADGGAASLRFAAANLVVSEDGAQTAAYWVVLARKPKQAMTLHIDGGGQLTAEPEVLTFNKENWDVAQVVKISAVDDEITEDSRQTAVLYHHLESGNSAGKGLEPQPLAVTVVDNDQAGVAISQSELATGEDGAAAYSVHLTSRPQSGVLIDLQGSDRLEVSGANCDGGEGGQNCLYFAPEAWDVPQVVTVRTNGSGHITHQVISGDFLYHGLPVGTVRVNLGPLRYSLYLPLAQGK